MVKLVQPRHDDLNKSIHHCLKNGERLLDDVDQLEFNDPAAATRLMLAMIAQEEFCKAFLLWLVKEEIVPWDTDLMRAMNSHASKHLVAIVLEYLDPQWDTLDELQEIIRKEFELDGAFPPAVRSALNILYFEKMRRDYPDDDDDNDPQVREIASGSRDKTKQEAVYVNVDRSGRAKTLPSEIAPEAAKREYDAAYRFHSFVRRLLEGESPNSEQFRKLREAMTIVYWQKYRPVEP